jgi:hypothetical protein
MDLELTPVRLRLIGLVTLEVNLLFAKIKKTLFSKNIWEYSTATIRKNMIDVSTKEPDESPPQFAPVVNKKGVSIAYHIHCHLYI